MVDGFTARHVSEWRPPKQVPSAGFKALCKQLAKLHESTSDVWPARETEALFARVHSALLRAVEVELVRGRAMAHDSQASRLGLS